MGKAHRPAGLLHVQGRRLTLVEQWSTYVWLNSSAGTRMQRCFELPLGFVNSPLDLDTVFPVAPTLALGASRVSDKYYDKSVLKISVDSRGWGGHKPTARFGFTGAPDCLYSRGAKVIAQCRFSRPGRQRKAHRSVKLSARKQEFLETHLF